MTTEEPEIGFDVELRAYFSFAVGAPGLRNLADPIEHQQRRQGQLRVAGSEQLATTAGDEVLIAETIAPLSHLRGLIPRTARRAKPQLGFVTQEFASRKRPACRFNVAPNR